MSELAPSRIVSLQPSATTTLDRLGLAERVVACTRYCLELCPHLADRIIVHDSWTAQAEQIVAARPDLVIASVPYQQEAVAQILRSGARLLALAPRTLADVFGDIAAIAGVMQAAERGQALLDDMRRQFDAVRQVAQQAAGRPRVFCEEWGKPLRSSQAWVAELAHLAGGEFVGEPGVAVDPEAVRAANPDVLLFAWCGAGDRVPMEKVVAQRGWAEMRAVRHRRVYVVRDDLLTTPGPPLAAGVRALAYVLHPDLFPPRRRAPVCLNTLMPAIEASAVAREIDSLAATATSSRDLMARICERLHERMLKYNWVGFYLLEKEPNGDPVLVLGPFVGAMTPHTRIPLHQGICGAAASSGKTVVVDDVRADPRYLACSLETKSEIVAPVFVRGKVVGELDIDSHFPAAFAAEDKELVEHCAAVVGRYLEKHK